MKRRSIVAIVASAFGLVPQQADVAGRCRMYGRTCKRDNQCCGFNFCYAGSCSCTRDGPCYSNRDCCSRKCRPNGTCKRGQPRPNNPYYPDKIFPLP